jgi:hypothetical protein
VEGVGAEASESLWQCLSLDGSRFYPRFRLDGIAVGEVSGLEGRGLVVESWSRLGASWSRKMEHWLTGRMVFSWRCGLHGDPGHSSWSIQGLRVSPQRSSCVSVIELMDWQYCRVCDFRGCEARQGGARGQAIHGPICLYSRGEPTRPLFSLRLCLMRSPGPRGVGSFRPSSHPR